MRVVGYLTTAVVAPGTVAFVVLIVGVAAGHPPLPAHIAHVTRSWGCT